MESMRILRSFTPPQAVLQVFEQVNHLGLDGDVQGGNGFVAYDQ
jgi:hypothetical protein